MSPESADPIDNPSNELRLAFWNVWLLSPQLREGGRRVLRQRFAPDVERRAPLVGEAIRDRFDVVAFGEAFEVPDRREIHRAVGRGELIPGPSQNRRSFTSSGLATFVDTDRVGIVETHSLAYRHGGDVRDSDTFANKGALHVRLASHADAPPIDLFSTHLFAGGGFFGGFGADDTHRHHRVRVRQLGEFVEFVQRHRAPEAALVLAGDFNVCAYDPEPTLPSPTQRYDEMTSILAPLGVSDVWAEHGVGLGNTCTFNSAADLPPDPQCADRVADLHDSNLKDPLTVPGERIDYLWFAPPMTSPDSVSLTEPQRWAFPGRPAQGGPAGSLSDHLAISATLRFSAA